MKFVLYFLFCFSFSTIIAANENIEVQLDNAKYLYTQGKYDDTINAINQIKKQLTEIMQNDQTTESIKVSVYQLLTDYTTNKIKANKKYKNKSLQISGVVKKITKNEQTQQIDITLENYYCELTCYFSNSNYNDFIEDLDSNTKVIVYGTISNFSNDNLIIDSSKIEKIEEDN